GGGAWRSKLPSPVHARHPARPLLHACVRRRVRLRARRRRSRRRLGRATDPLQHPGATPTPTTPLSILSMVAPNATVGGQLAWVVDSPGRAIDHVDFAVDGAGAGTSSAAPFELALDTRTLAEGAHALAVNVSFHGGGYAIATWSITVANAAGSLLSPPSGPVEVGVAKSSLPPAPTAPPTPRVLYRAIEPAQAVTMKQLDAALVGYLGLGAAARAIQSTLRGAGLQPPANTGTETVARLLGLRLNHPAAQDALELLPGQAATR